MLMGILLRSNGFRDYRQKQHFITSLKDILNANIIFIYSFDSVIVPQVLSNFVTGASGFLVITLLVFNWMNFANGKLF